MQKCLAGGESLKHAITHQIFFCAYDAAVATLYAQKQLYIQEFGFDIDRFRLPARDV